MIVIDVGCATYGGDSSIPYLIGEFKPTLLIGFDPGTEYYGPPYESHGCMVVETPWAACTYSGTIGWEGSGLRGHAVPDSKHRVPCVDLAHFILGLRAQPQQVVLKMDAEGAEWTLLPHLVEHGVDESLLLAWVEYHCGRCGRGGGREISHLPNCREDAAALAARVEEMEGRMRCEMHRWNR